MGKYGITVLMGIALVGCVTTEELYSKVKPNLENKAQESYVNANQQNGPQTPSRAKQSLHHETEILVNQLVTNNERELSVGDIAVGTILPASDLSSIDEDYESKALSIQIQESLITVLTQKNFPVVEYKTTKALHIRDHADHMLSRDLDELKVFHNIKYFMTGTYTATEAGYFINARLVDTDNNQVMAAATHFISADILFPKRTTHLKHGRIHRGE